MSPTMASNVPSRGLCQIIHLDASPDDAIDTQSDQDRESMEWLFDNLGFTVTVTGLTEDEAAHLTVKMLVRDFAERSDHLDVAILIILASRGVLFRGLLDQIVCTDTPQFPLPIQDVVQAFNDVACPALRGKQKLLLFQVDDVEQAPSWQTVASGAVSPLSNVLIAFPVEPMFGKTTFATTVSNAVSQSRRGDDRTDILELLKQAGRCCPNVVIMHGWAKPLLF